MMRAGAGLIIAGLLALSPAPSLAAEALHPTSDTDLLGCWIKDRTTAQIRRDDVDGAVDQFTLCFERNWDATTTAIGGSKAYGLEGIDGGGHYAIDRGRLSVRGPSVSDTWFFGSAARCDALTDGHILHLTNCIGYGSGGDEPTVLDATSYARAPKS